METEMTAAYGDARPQRRIDVLLAHYALSHRHPVNERIHCVAVPVIMISLIGLMMALHPVVGGGFLLASLVYYLRLSMRAFVLMLIWSVVLAGIALGMGEVRAELSIVLFAAGWIAQFIGHRIEGRKPSFFEDIQYLWIGPLFVAQVLLRPVGWRW